MAEHSRILVIAVSCLVIIISGGLILLPHLKSEQLWEERTVELGSGLSDDASMYVSGNGWVVKHTAIDTSDVNLMRVGDYTAKAISPFNECDYKVSVRDTIPPDLDTGEGWKKILCTGKEYDPSVLGATASDLSGIATLKYYYDGKEIDRLCFDRVSRPEITISATDSNMNTTEKTVRLIVDSPPRFYGVHDQYVLIGSSIEDLDPVFACDDADGGLTSKIKSDYSSLKLRNIGDYRIKYSVRDSLGLEAQAESTVHVVSSAQRVKEHRDDCRIDSDDLSYAVEEGFFESSPFDSPDHGRVIKECGVSLVNLFVDMEDSTSSGSAFIYEVDPDYVYMISVYHVTSELERYPVTITFYDGTSVRTAIRSIRLSAGNEAALFRVPVRIVPYHVLVRIREVATEDDIYDYVKAGTPLIEYCRNWRGGDLPEVVKDVTVISFQLSEIQKKYVDDDSYFAATRKSISGMSGTAVFDYRGVLSGICSKTMYPLESEEVKFRDGCDFVLMVDKLDELMARKDEL